MKTLSFGASLSAVLVSMVVSPGSASAQCQLTELVHDQTDPRLFGKSLATNGEVLAVGVFEDSSPQTGHVLLYEIGESGWVQAATLSAPDVTDNLFGYSVALAEPWLAVGAPEDNQLGLSSGAVYLFELSGGAWQFSAKITPITGSPDQAGFGHSVALTQDRLVVGAPFEDPSGAGAAYFFQRTGSIWAQTQREAPACCLNPAFGQSCAIAGDTVLIGAPDAEPSPMLQDGIVWVYKLIGGTWQSTAQLTSPVQQTSKFGWAVALDDSIAVIGAPGQSWAFVFDATKFGANPKRLHPPGVTTSDWYGVSVSVHDQHVLIGADRTDNPLPSSGAVYLHDVSDLFNPTQLLPPTPAQGDGFGGHLTMHGNLAYVAAIGSDVAGPEAGAVHVFEVQQCSGIVYCAGQPNSTGQPAELLALTSEDAADPCFTLFSKQLPAGEFGYFLVGSGSSMTTPPGSQGDLCLGGAAIGRLLPPLSTGPLGLLVREVDLTALPLHPPVQVQPGETWNFQGWYRDTNPGATSNFTEAIAVTFQ